MTDAEVLTTAPGAAHCFGGNVEHSRRFLRETGLTPGMLSRSRLCRRLHAVADLAYTLLPARRGHEGAECLDELPA